VTERKAMGCSRVVAERKAMGCSRVVAARLGQAEISR
jgi:hypothetical protein